MKEEHQIFEDALEERRELLQKEWDELLKRDLSNTENLAKYIFSLSSAGLGVSLIVVRDMNLLDTANFKSVLIISWGAFLIAIICALISYLTSLRAIYNEFGRIRREHERIDLELLGIDWEHGQKNVKDSENKKNLICMVTKICRKALFVIFSPDNMTRCLRYTSVIFCIVGVISTPLFIVLNILYPESSR